MKNKITAIVTILLTIFISEQYAQAPQQMSYQAVVRDAGDELVNNTAIGMQISILQGSPSGTAVYVETQTPTSNANGLVTIEIGSGVVVFGVFSAVDWASGPYFVKTEIDPAGGTSYTITGISQMLSVPYALYSETTGSIPPGTNPGEMLFWNGSSWIAVTPGQNDQTLTYCDGVPTWGSCPGCYDGIQNGNESGVDCGGPDCNVCVQDALDAGMSPCDIVNSGVPLSHLYGKSYLGGQIFYFNQTTCEGLIAAHEDQGNQDWGCSGQITGADADGIGAGYFNTQIIIAGCMTYGIAARLCTDLGPEWYLPSIEELTIMFQNLKLNGLDNFDNDFYWSSTEFDINLAMTQDFSLFSIDANSSQKSDHNNVRAVRAFSPCSDGIQNGNETAVDCGGPDCPTCASLCGDRIQNGDETSVDCGGPDCPTCVSLCGDGIQNGDETGVDCGGPDCPTCVSLCGDGIQNGNETSVDCGGPDCPTCLSLCGDGIQNGGETDVDCGGPDCAACPTIQERLDGGESPCEIYNSGVPLDQLWGKSYSDGLIFFLDIFNCEGWVAKPQDQGEAEWGCNNTNLQGAESASGFQNTQDIIAGCGEADIAAKLCTVLGPEWFLPSSQETILMYSHLKVNGFGSFSLGATKYWTSTEDNNGQAYSQSFNTGSTGASPKIANYNVRAVKAFPTCGDGFQNGEETSVDCGGPDCPTCASLCGDGIQNGDETDVDCGGPDCAVCPTCSDGIQNGNETDVDCGGPDCVACPTCSDGILNGFETDVDCGGPDCAACPPTIQERLNAGETPCDIYDGGAGEPLDSLYGKIYMGGLIFYLNTTNCEGLVAKPQDQGFTNWGCVLTNLPGAESASGYLNTQDIITGCGEAGIAARLCTALGPEWFLPSSSESILMYDHLKVNGFGSFGTNKYWTSTEFNDGEALIQSYNDGTLGPNYKHDTVNVRAVRAF